MRPLLLLLMLLFLTHVDALMYLLALVTLLLVANYREIHDLDEDEDTSDDGTTR
jgi:hypothetical protein